jgi:hypothetical protein
VSGAIQLPGVRFQKKKKRNIEAETCWSEAEIPSEAKRQRETLKPETSVFVIDDETELYVMNGETELNIEVRQSLETILPRQMVTCQVGLMPR